MLEAGDKKGGRNIYVKVGKVVAAKAKAEVWSKRRAGEQAGYLAVSRGLARKEPTNGGIARGSKCGADWRWRYGTPRPTK